MKAKNDNHQLLSLKGMKLYKIAGWSLFGICLLHFIFWSIITWQSWPAWASGILWDTNSKTLEHAILDFHFWALPGSFMIPLLLLSLLIVRAAKRQDKLPSYLGWVLLIWVVACGLMLLPSGFWLGVAPAVLLIVANKKHYS